jgi:hypothetical protein
MRASSYASAAGGTAEAGGAAASSGRHAKQVTFSGNREMRDRAGPGRDMVAVLVAASAPLPRSARVMKPWADCAASGTGSEADYGPAHLGKASASDNAQDVAAGPTSTFEQRSMDSVRVVAAHPSPLLSAARSGVRQSAIGDAVALADPSVTAAARAPLHSSGDMA